jgi:surface antigen
MKSVVKTFALISASALMLSACDNSFNSYGNQTRPGVLGGGSGFNKQEVGTVLGGIGGAVAGAQFGKGDGRLVTTAIGALLGAGIGNSIGGSLDKADVAYNNRTAQTAFETGQSGQSLPWNNPKSGNSGVITPSNYYTGSNGQYCREFNQKITVGGKTESGYGTACRQPDGTWQIVSQ